MILITSAAYISNELSLVLSLHVYYPLVIVLY